MIWSLIWMVKHQIKQNTDWNRMHCFLTTFHQKEYCFGCHWWMMRSRLARLNQKIFNHIKWRFQFSLLLSVLRVSDWHLVGFTLMGRYLLTCSMHSILFSLHAQKKFHICPCSLLIIQWIFSQFLNDMLGSHSYDERSRYFVKRIASRPWLALSKFNLASSFRPISKSYLGSKSWLAYNKYHQHVSKPWLANSKSKFKQNILVDCRIF